MKAIVAKQPFGIANLRVVDCPEPAPPGPGQLLIRVTAGSLNYRDLLVGGGVGRWTPPSGRILGSDAAGVVVEIGESVEAYAPGDRVTSSFLPNWIDGPLNRSKASGALGGALRDGVFAEYIVLDAQTVVPAPAHMTDPEAATLVCAGVTAWHALLRADSLQPGRTVLVEGTGGVSTFALQMAAMAGARVIATSSSDAKLKRARLLGASDTINYLTIPDWAGEAVRLTDGEGVEHVLDIGGASTLGGSIAATAYEGTVSLIGLIGGQDATFNASDVFVRNIRLQGIETGSRTMLSDLGQWAARTGFRPTIAATYPLDDATAAFKHLSEQTAVGKICLTL